MGSYHKLPDYIVASDDQFDRVNEMKTIIRESDAEDYEIKVRRVGRHIWVSTERAGIARSVERDILEKLGGIAEQEPESAIGFRMED